MPEQILGGTVTARLSFDILSDTISRRIDMPLDWSACPAVESVPGKVSGAWVFRGTRIPVAAVFENLEDGLTIDQIVQMFDGLTSEQVRTVLDFAVHSLEVPSSAR